MSRGTLTIPFLCFFMVTLFSLSPPKEETLKEKFVVVLDAGHGGKDPGKVSKGYKEKDIALKIVLLIGKELEKNEDVKVIYTRKTDRFVNLFKRGEIANKANADLFISVHCNAHHTQAFGSETYVLGLHANKRNFEVAKSENEVIYLEENYEVNYSDYDISAPESMIGLTIMQEEFLDQSILLAKNIQENFTHKLQRKNRGVKQAGFIVLHQTFMPSVLVETGFITNKKERNYLLSDKGQKAIAKNITRAILNYKKVIGENVGDDLTYEIGNTVSVEEPEVQNDVIYKVQIAASARKLAPKNYNFKGLEPISIENANGIYRYFYGKTARYSEAEKLKTEAIKKGYETSFIVAYKEGKKIALSNLLNSASN